MLKEYKNNKIKLINEIYERCINKNYIHPSFLKDNLDYIASCVKASLNNYVLLKEKYYDKQTSLTTCMNKYLRYLGQNDDFLPETEKIKLKNEQSKWIKYPRYNNTIPYSKRYAHTETETYMCRELSYYESFLYFCEDMYRNLLSKYARSKNYKSVYNESSKIKFFVMCILDKTLFEQDFQYAKYSDEFDFEKYSKLYKNIYIHCRKISFKNTESYESLIKKILKESVEKVDFDNMEDKQIIKFINNKIRWKFYELRTKLPRYNYFRNLKLKRARQLNGKANITNAYQHVLHNWFNINERYSYSYITKDYTDKIEIENFIGELTYLNKNQKEFVVKICNYVNYNSKLIYRKNKNGDWDINKTEVAKHFKLTYDAFEKKCKRIKEKAIKNGEVIEVKPKDEIILKPRCLTKKDFENIYSERQDKSLAKALLDRDLRKNQYYEDTKDYPVITAPREFNKKRIK